MNLTSAWGHSLEWKQNEVERREGAFRVCNLCGCNGNIIRCNGYTLLFVNYFRSVLCVYMYVPWQRWTDDFNNMLRLYTLDRATYDATHSFSIYRCEPSDNKELYVFCLWRRPLSSRQHLHWLIFVIVRYIVIVLELKPSTQNKNKETRKNDITDIFELVAVACCELLTSSHSKVDDK